METALVLDWLYWILAVILLWASAAKLLSGSALASSPGMKWATREGLASGTIAGVVEFIAAALFLLTAWNVFSTDLFAVLVAFGIAAHEGVAAIKKVEADEERAAPAEGAEPPPEEAADRDEESRLPNLIIGAIALMVAALALVG